MLRQEFPGSIRAVSAGGFEFVAASSALARDSHVVVVSGLDTKHYLTGNPIILRDHMPSQPVGRCTGLRLDLSKQPNELRGSGDWAPEGVSAVADETRELARAGILNAISIGFDILESEPLKPTGGRGLRIKRSELLELSIVACGADPLAVITQRAYARGNMSKHLIRASEAVAEARRHHHDLARALDNEDDRGATRSLASSAGVCGPRRPASEISPTKACSTTLPRANRCRPVRASLREHRMAAVSRPANWHFPGWRRRLRSALSRRRAGAEAAGVERRRVARSLGSRKS
jgi:phage head maturation protease